MVEGQGWWGIASGGVCMFFESILPEFLIFRTSRKVRQTEQGRPEFWLIPNIGTFAQIIRQFATDFNNSWQRGQKSLSEHHQAKWIKKSLVFHNSPAPVQGRGALLRGLVGKDLPQEAANTPFCPSYEIQLHTVVLKGVRNIFMTPFSAICPTTLHLAYYSSPEICVILRWLRVPNSAGSWNAGFLVSRNASSGVFARRPTSVPSQAISPPASASGAVAGRRSGTLRQI